MLSKNIFCALKLSQFEYIGLYELFELLEKLSQAGFIDADLIKSNHPGVINAGKQSEEDKVSHEQALDWFAGFLRFYNMEYIV